MKKFLILLLFSISLQNIQSQGRLGDSLNEIKEEFSKYNIRQSICNDGLNALSFELDSLIIIYYFDKYNICTNTLIATKSKIIAKKFMCHYDSNYIIINDYTWKVTENLSVAYISSYYDRVLGFIFVWDYDSSELWLQEIVLEEPINSLQALIKK